MTSLDSLGGETWLTTTSHIERNRLLRTMRRAALSLGKLTGLVALLGVGLAVASSLVKEKPSAALPEPSPKVWVEMRKPIPIFALTRTDFAKLPMDYAAFRNAGGGGRRDTMTFGDPHADKAWLRLSLYRVGTEAAPIGDMDKDLIAGGAEMGVAVSRIATRTVVSTRFGLFDAADLRVGEASISTPCLGFRSQVTADAPLRMSGLVCGSAEHPASRDLLRCIIDRVDLLAAGEDQVLRDLFVAAERRRGYACQPAPLTEAGSRTTWLDANGSAPILKELTSSRGRHGKPGTPE